jgi:hypothetical protein
MIKIIRREKNENSELFSTLYTSRNCVHMSKEAWHRENEDYLSKYHKAPQGVIQLDEMYICTKENESILLMLVLLHLFLYSYNFLFQIQSSSSTDFPAKSRSRGSGIFSFIQCCNISPHLYKACTPGVINVLNHATQIYRV